MRGMSSGVIVAVAVAVVALIVALVALVFVFHSNNSSTGSAVSHTQQGALGQILNTSTSNVEPSTQPISNAGAAYMVYNLTTNQVTIHVTLVNPGNTHPAITSVAVNGVPVTLNSITDVVNGATYTGTQPGQINILTGYNYLTISGTLPQALDVQPGESVTVQITLSNALTVTLAAVVQS